jgi:flagellar biosynthetic protein FliQ
MTPELVLEILNHAMIATVKIAAPLLLSSLAVGVIVSIIQALTQIQESTLTFVPKIMVLFAVLAISMPFIGGVLGGFTEELYSHIVDVS